MLLVKKGIQMEWQGSAASNSENLQLKIRRDAENGISLNALAVIQGRRPTAVSNRFPFVNDQMTAVTPQPSFSNELRRALLPKSQLRFLSVFGFGDDAVMSCL